MIPCWHNEFLIKVINMSVLVTKEAPNFVAQAVMPDGSINASFDFREYIKDSIAILFFYPLNFTFVCPSELIALNQRIKEFEGQGVKIIAVSVDSAHSHIAYRNIEIQNGGIGNVQFPIVADLKKEVAKAYDVLFNESIALRGAFIIDAKGVVRSQIVNDLPLGRNIDELLRLVQAIKFNNEHGEVCPANWSDGQEGMKPTKEGVATYLKNKYGK